MFINTTAFAAISSSLVFFILFASIPAGILLFFFFDREGERLVGIFSLIVSIAMAIAFYQAWKKANYKVIKEITSYEKFWKEAVPLRKQIAEVVRDEFANYPPERIRNPEVRKWFEKIRRKQ
ncbi:hypothetical protein [Desulfurobacterium sp.]